MSLPISPVNSSTSAQDIKSEPPADRTKHHTGLQSPAMLRFLDESAKEGYFTGLERKAGPGRTAENKSKL